ncbi:efflux RND transporter periplasmic adaptor subunit, partial [Pseudoxanthomonas sp. SGD-10]
MKIKYVVYSLLVLIVAYLIYDRVTPETKKESTTRQDSRREPARLNAIVVTTQKFDNIVQVSGTIEADEQVQITSEISGLVRSINFNEGSQVQKGSLLVKIDDRELQAQLAQALTRERLAAEVEDRSGKLLKSEAISQEEYDNVLAELKSLQAQTQLIRAQLSKTEIRAPFSGRIGLRNISNGAYVTPNTVIANLVSVNPVKINFSVPEKYARRVKTGTSVDFTIAGSNKSFTAKVYAIEPAIDINTRTLLLRARADNKGGELLPGTFANIRLPLETIEDAILVPSQAVVPVLKGKQIYVVEQGKAKDVMIESDIRTDKD